MPKVSIIVPIYNVEKYLDRCMMSLLSQTLKDIEIIMVDDGSPDNCPNLCDEYKKKDSRVKVVHKKNEGLGYARNSGLDVASGEYVAFVDSDDFVEDSMYAKLYNAAVSEKADVAYCNHFIFHTATNHVGTPYAPVEESITFRGSEVVDEVMKNMIASAPEATTERKYYMSVWRGIFRRSVIGDLRFESERDYLSEDIIYQVAVLQCASVVTFVHDRLYYYRENEISLTHAYRKDRVEKSIALYERLNDIVCNTAEKSSGEWNIRLMKLLYGYFRFSLFSNISAVEAKKRDLKEDFLKSCDYLEKISFFSKYPISILSLKHKLILFLFKHKLFLPFYALAKIAR